ncbi:E3 ubiquitin-protein ligase makorin-2-like [Aethina tumida]|uniref:E3 ubiquitin-protein ligase makorin-2-like n=1 Tax=Aethina tumida TaxID=116153 RepID=UPI0021482884|nr:E3 ubiquitin-protein ligase makorin-2-like [Aethina tumida]
MNNNRVPQWACTTAKTCSICYNEIPSEESPTYGVLTLCEHVFCYGCISTWKKYCNLQCSGVRCPMCRRISSFIVRCKYFPKDTQTKLIFVKHVYLAVIKYLSTDD